MKTYAKKSLSILLSLIMLLSCLAGLDFSAYSLSSSGSCGDNVKYTFNSSTGELVISGTGAMKNYNYDSSSPFRSSNIKSVVINLGVTSIGAWAFYDCTSLTSVTIPNSVKSIGDSAFDYCTSLTSVNINSIEAWCNISFYNYDSNPLYYAHNLYINGNWVTDLIIPNSVTSIGDYAFSNCTSLTSVTIPDSVTSIGYEAFYNVPNIIYKGTATGSPWGAKFLNGYVDGYLVYKDSTKKELLKCSNKITNIVIPDSVTSIGDWAFSDCTSLTSVEIPNSVRGIGACTFYGCKSLTSVTIPNSVTSIGGHAFENCTSLTNVTIPNSVTSIGDCAFRYCTSLTSVTIPDSVTSIGYGTFCGCTSLTSVTIPNSVTSIGGSAFEFCESLTSVTIPNSVTSIEDDAFRNCTSITSVTIGNSVTSIGSRAFENCRSLTSVTIPNSVTSIGLEVFSVCESLTSVTISNSVTSIGYRAFSWCTSLTSVTIPNSVTSIGDYAFYNCKSLTDIYYIGTESQWSNISKGSSAIPSTTTIHSHTEHTFSIVEEVTRIPCTRDGYISYRCDVCRMGYTEIFSMHTTGKTVIENRIEPTCAKDGFYDEVVYCSVCSKELNRIHKILTKLGHTPAEKIIENRIEPTCTEDGSYDEVVYCSVCNEEINRNGISVKNEILIDSSAYPESPHNYTDNMNKTYSFSYPGAISLIITFSSSTATESRYDYIYLYNSNGSQIGKYDGTSLAGKAFTIDGNSFSIKLTSDGSQTKYGFSFSSIYAVTKDESLSALGHSFTNYISDDNYTCTEGGTKTAKCDRCNETDTIADVGSGDHRYSIIGSKAPTCEAKGMTIYQCSECGSKKVETSGALGHIEVIVKGCDPTCKENGYTDSIVCDRCGEIFEKPQIIKPLGHDLTSKVIAPTCLNEGYTVYSCSRCEYQSRISVKPALGHNFGTYEYNNDATCTKDGTKTAKCVHCEETDTLLDLNHLACHKYELFDSTATCTEDGFDVYICSECDDIDYIEVKAGHKFLCEIVGGELQYTCSVCGEIENKTAEDIKALWNDDFSNSAPAMGEDSAYLDVNNDGIINAKDYVRIMRMK